jgi:anti-anti-sigma factor
MPSAPPATPGRSTLGPPAPFTVQIRSGLDAVEVRPVGELDLVTVPLLDLQLRHLRDVCQGPVLLDLRSLTFMESRGVRLCLAWCSDGDGRVALREGAVARHAIDAVGLRHRVPVAVR